MEKKQEILEFRKKLDNALFSPDLINDDSMAALVKEQLIRSSLRNDIENVGKIVESHTVEVANFLEMLRSASGTSNSHLNIHKEWKIKQDTDELRVMYREGLHGSPFNTLLAEGFADGPMDVCLCASWETTLYRKWWPQYSIPTFKIITSSCLQRVGIGEEISLIRVKVPWPVSDREAVLHYFEVEYFKEDLILVLIKTISDTENIDAGTHGFTREGIPQAKDTIRIDMVGGFALQKVGSNRCYFRAIFNFDIKLEFIPPSLVNFISRQLIGNGHKLYQKAVGSVATNDEDYQLALQGPLYARIRQPPLPDYRPETSLEISNKENLAFFPNEHNEVDTQGMGLEITEEDLEQSANGSSGNLDVDKQWISSHKEQLSISPEVEHALSILDQVISVVRSQSVFAKNGCNFSSVGDDFSLSELLGEVGLFNDGHVPEVGNKLNNYKGNSLPDGYSDLKVSAREENGGHKQAMLLARRVHRLSTPESNARKVSNEESQAAANEFCERGSAICGKTKTKKRKKKLLNLQNYFCLSPSCFQDCRYLRTT